MKDIKKMLKKDEKGFTLMELLIVVAIIAILVAIAIPTLTSQLEKARESADIANIRSAYAEAVIAAIDDDEGEGEATSEAMTQTKEGWQSAEWPAYLGSSVSPTKGDTVTVTIGIDDDGEQTVTCEID